MKKYYREKTEMALKNFPFSLPRVDLEFIDSIVKIKKSAAIAHYLSGELSKDFKNAISLACDEILSRKFDNQFVTPSIQGGMGTSINMNVNEVIASRASEISGKKIHPNDHVNMSQSTNDVNPSALKIASIKLTKRLLIDLDYLIKTFSKKSKEFKTVVKLGRTHYQDAVPTTLGEEFLAYTKILERDKKRIEQVLEYLYELNLGGSAIGNSINASKNYIKNVYKELKKITGFPLKPSENLMSQTSSATDFCHLMSVVTILSLDMSKIANDLRFMSSGPRGGIGEITLPILQPGSSIMPGKVNPILPEMVNQTYFFVSGKNLTVQKAAEAAHMELAVMIPVTVESVISSLKLVSEVIRVFADRCVKGITANRQKARELLENSTAYATLLSPHLGYDTVSLVVKEAVKTGKTIREVILKKKLLSSQKLDKLLDF